MQASDAGGTPAGIEEFIERAKAGPKNITREVVRLGEEPGDMIMLREVRDGDGDFIGSGVTLIEAQEMADALILYGGAGMPEALLKMALAVKVLSFPTGRVV
jgi:hypothetical protein